MPGSMPRSITQHTVVIASLMAAWTYAYAGSVRLKAIHASVMLYTTTLCTLYWLLIRLFPSLTDVIFLEVKEGRSPGNSLSRSGRIAGKKREKEREREKEEREVGEGENEAISKDHGFVDRSKLSVLSGFTARK